MMVKRLTTFVIAISPTFWLKEVTGRQPNREEMLLAKPSQAREPDISFSVISRSRPETTMAVVSPIVSVAETRNITTTDKIAPKWNSGIKGKILGRDIIPPANNPDKSTIPIIAESMYPTIRPNSMESCFQKDLAKMLNKMLLSSVTNPIKRLVDDPKESL